MMESRSGILLGAVALLAVAGFPAIADSQWTPQPAAMAYGLVGSGPNLGGRAEPCGRAFSGRGSGGSTLGCDAPQGGRIGFSDDSRADTPRHSDPLPGPSQPDLSDAANTADTQSGRANGNQTGRNGSADRSGRGSRAGGIEGGSVGVGNDGRGDKAGRQ